MEMARRVAGGGSCALIALAALALLLLPSPAAAGTVSTSSGDIVFSASAGEANRVTISPTETGSVRVVDLGAPLTASGECAVEDANTAVCPWSEISYVDLGDLDDTLTRPPFSFFLVETKIRAGEGNDYVTGGESSDWIYGGPGDDTLNGGDNFDYLDGGHGNDVLRGGRRPDRLYGRWGNDVLEGGHGRDRAIGGPGDDLFRMRDAFRDNVWGQLGYDRASVDRRRFDRLFGVEELL